MWCIINNSLPSHMLSQRPKAKRKRLTMWNACETYMYMKAHVQIFFSVIPSNSILLNIFTHFLCHLKMHIHLLFDTSPPQSEFHKCVKMFIPWIKKKTLKAMCKMFFFCHNVFNWVWFVYTCRLLAGLCHYCYQFLFLSINVLYKSLYKHNLT